MGRAGCGLRGWLNALASVGGGASSTASLRFEDDEIFGAATHCGRIEARWRRPRLWSSADRHGGSCRWCSDSASAKRQRSGAASRATDSPWQRATLM